MRVLTFTSRFARDDRGQDLLEYGLLAGIIGVTSLILLTTVAPKMETAYADWNTAQEAAWEPCDPIEIGGCP